MMMMLSSRRLLLLLGCQLFLASYALAFQDDGDSNSNIGSIQRSFQQLPRRLPAQMNQFAWHPSDPNWLVTISSATNQIYLFSKSQLLKVPMSEDDTEIEPVSVQPVGNLPNSMVWKQDTVIVGCVHDSHLHMFQVDDTDSQAVDLKLIQTVEIQGAAVTHLAASSKNQDEDPYVYYNFLPSQGAGMEQPALGVLGMDSTTGQWIDLGIIQVQDDDLVSMKATISPGGTMLYNTGNRLPMASYQLTFNNTASSITLPTLTIYYCQQDGYVLQREGGLPDPSGYWVAAQNYMFHSGLVDKAAVLPTVLTPFTDQEMANTCKGSVGGECCPFKSVFQDFEGQLGAIKTRGVVISTYSPSSYPSLGFGIRNPWNSDGIYIPRYNDGAPLPPQVTAVYTSNDDGTLGKATKHNVTIPRALLGSGKSRRLEEWEGEDDDMMEEEEMQEDEMDVSWNNNGESSSDNLPTELHLLTSGDSLWIAMADRMAVTPTYCFLGPDVPDVQLDSTQFIIGGGGTTARFTFDQGFSMSLTSLPDGATFNEDTKQLKWAPTPEQVGEYTVDGVFTDTALIGCTFSMEITATYPATTLAHAIERFTVTPDGRTAAAWSLTNARTGTATDTNLTLLEYDDNGNVASSSTAFLPFVTSQVIIGDKMLFLFEQLCETVHVLDRTSLDETKSFPNPAMMNKYNCESRDLFLVDNGKLRICNSYNCQDRNDPVFVGSITGNDLVEVDVEKPYYQSSSGGGRGSQIFMEGIFKDGILYDHLDNSNVLLVLDHGPFFVGGQSQENNKASSNMATDYVEPPPFERSSSPFDFLHPIQNPGGSQLLEIPESGIVVQYDYGRESYQNDGSRVHNSTLTVYDLSGHLVEKNTLFSLIWDRNQQRGCCYNSGRNGNQPIVTNEGSLFVPFDHQLYVWTWKGDPPVPAESKGFHFVDKQSVIKISKSSKAELSHTLKGGSEPFEVFLQYSSGYDSALLKSIIAVNEGAATLVVDGPKFYDEAVKAMVAFGANRGIPEVRSASLKSIDPWSKLPAASLPADGTLPVALPIYLQAIDSKGEKASISYYVYIELQYDKLVPLINQAMDDLLKGNSTANSNEESIDKRDLEILLLITMVILLTIILVLVLCLVFYKMVLQKDNANPVEKSEVDGLIRTSNGGEAKSNGAANKDSNDTLESSEQTEGESPEPEIV